MRGGLRLLAVVFALGAALATGVLLGGRDAGGPGGTAGGSRPAEGRTDEGRIRSLVARRAGALAAGRRARLAATATGRRADRDRLEARRAERLGVSRVRTELEDLSIRGDRATARARITYAIDGVPGRFAARRRMTLVRRKDAWRVRSLAGSRQRAPWEVAAYRRVRSEHFVVLAPPGVDPAAGGLLAALEEGHRRMREILVSGRLRRRYLVVVAAGAAQARALTAGIRGLDRLAALTDTEVREAGPERRVSRVLSQRLIVVWSNFQAAGPEQGPTVVVHELTHAALAPQTSGRTPSWLAEGMALYVSEDRRVGHAAELLAAPASERSVRRALSLRGLRHPDAIARLDGDAQAASYAYASAAAFYVAERFGRDALVELYDAFNDPDVLGQDAAVRKVLGLGIARLERDLRRWVAVQGPLAP